MIVGIGTDLIDCRRLEKVISNQGQRFLDRVFTEEEQRRSKGRSKSLESFGKIYAAKEATVKAIGNVSGIHWKDIEINHLPSGKPVVTLSGQAFVNFKALFKGDQKSQIDVSITDEPPYAQAFVVISAE